MWEKNATQFWKGFYCINCAHYLHLSPIITCTTACHLLYCLGARWFLPQWSLTSEWPHVEPTPQKAPQTGIATVEPEDGAPRQFKTPKPWLRVCPGHERMEARTPHIPPSISCVHEFTSGGHQAGFTTGQQKHVILHRTPYLGAYVRENQVHVPLISIIHHKLCKGAIGRAKP